MIIVTEYICFFTDPARLGERKDPAHRELRLKAFNLRCRELRLKTFNLR